MAEVDITSKKPSPPVISIPLDPPIGDLSTLRIEVPFASFKDRNACIELAKILSKYNEFSFNIGNNTTTFLNRFGYWEYEDDDYKQKIAHKLILNDGDEYALTVFDEFDFLIETYIANFIFEKQKIIDITRKLESSGLKYKFN